MNSTHGRSSLTNSRGVGQADPGRGNFCSSTQLGSLRLLFDAHRWDWSPAVEQLHGYRPGTTTPSTALLISHVHPHDRAHLRGLIDDTRRTRVPFTTRHRVIDAHGGVHDVAVIGAPIYQRGDPTPIGMHCACVDLTLATPHPEPDRDTARVAQLRVTARHGYLDDQQRQRIRAATRC
ncbi:PAS domain-containing protein [Mycobacterium sp. pW049]|uniref:PAS domain-containing protein n=1 Tax=[Mycobacterium] bulgaricum TaxID=3238985 RepID=UPI00351B1E85